MAKFRVQMWRAVAETTECIIDAASKQEALVRGSLMARAMPGDQWRREEVLKSLPPQVAVKELKDDGQAAA